MVVPAGKADAPAPIRPDDPPEQGLTLAFGQVAVTGPDIIDPQQIFFIGGGRAERQGILMIMNFEIKFVHSIDGTHAIRGFMSLHRFNFGPPERIYGNPVFEKSSNPWKIVFFSLLHAGMNRIVHKNDTHFFLLNQLVHLFPPVTNDLGTIGINNNRIRIFKNPLILGPSGIDHGLYLNFILNI